MASTSFKKVLSEPFIKRMIIRLDNEWRAIGSRVVSAFVKPVKCMLSCCVVDVQCGLVAGSPCGGMSVHCNTGV